MVERLVSDAERIGKSGRTSVYRWQDPSGARLVVEMRSGVVEHVLPSYAGLAGAQVGGVVMVDDEVARCSVVDESGEEMTRIMVAFEERAFALGRSRAYSGPASIVALGVDVRTFESAETFAAADESLVYADPDHVPDPPPHVVEFGLEWPPRLEMHSVISYGAFAEAQDVDAYARLYGTVLGASSRTVQLTGQSFQCVDVRTVGMDVEMCFPAPADADLPRTGEIIGGSVVMVGSLGASSGTGRRVRRW